MSRTVEKLAVVVLSKYVIIVSIPMLYNTKVDLIIPRTVKKKKYTIS